MAKKEQFYLFKTTEIIDDLTVDIKQERKIIKMQTNIRKNFARRQREKK